MHTCSTPPRPTSDLQPLTSPQKGRRAGGEVIVGICGLGHVHWNLMDRRGGAPQAPGPPQPPGGLPVAPPAHLGQGNASLVRRMGRGPRPSSQAVSGLTRSQ